MEEKSENSVCHEDPRDCKANNEPYLELEVDSIFAYFARSALLFGLLLNLIRFLDTVPLRAYVEGSTGGLVRIEPNEPEHDETEQKKEAENAQT